MFIRRQFSEDYGSNELFNVKLVRSKGFSVARFLATECFVEQVVNRALFVSMVLVVINVSVNAPLVQVIGPHYQANSVATLGVRVRTLFVAFGVEALKLK